MPPGPSHTPAPYGSLHVRKRSSRWQNLPSAAGLALVACRRQPGGACTGRGRLIQLPAGLWGGGGAAGNLTFLAVALHRKAGEALAPLPPTTSGVLHGGQSLGATSFLWPHVLPAGMHAGNKKVVRPPAGMAFRYFLSRVALMKISTLRFLTGEVEPMGRSRGKLPVLLAVSALPQLSPCCGWGGPTHPAGLWGAQ